MGVCVFFLSFFLLKQTGLMIIRYYRSSIATISDSRSSGDLGRPLTSSGVRGHSICIWKQHFEERKKYNNNNN